MPIANKPSGCMRYCSAPTMCCCNNGAITTACASASMPGWHCLVLIVLLMGLVSSCGTRRTRALTPVPPALELLAPCRRPPPIPDGQVRTLVINHLQAMQELDDCARRQAALADWTRVVSELTRADEGG